MIDHHTIALLSPIFISFILGIQLVSCMSKKPDVSKKILAGFMMLIFSISIFISIRQSGNLHLFRFFDSILMSLMLVIHPLFYHYIKCVSLNEIHWKKDIIHYFPSLAIFIVGTILYLLISKQEALDYLSIYILGEPATSFALKSLYVIFLLSKYIHAIQAIVYFILVYKILINHREYVETLFSNTENYRLNWLFLFNIIYSLISLIGIIVNLIPTRLVFTTTIYIEITMIFMALFTLYIGIKGLSQKSVGAFIQSIENKFPDKMSKVLSQESLLQKIHNFVVINEAFLNPDLKIWDIVNNTGINRSYISHIINKEYRLNFNGYINKLRIETACKKLKEKNFESIEGIAFECGFNSISTFYRAFKIFTGVLPTQYRVN